MVVADKYYSKQIKDMEEQEEWSVSQDGDELFRRGGPRRKKVTKSRIPPGIFLRSAVRPFTYRNLVKEIVLTRHALVEGEIGSSKKGSVIHLFFWSSHIQKIIRKQPLCYHIGFE
ncbi:hypothetical protein LIER_09069 [Lithospermum erythrorhizon]|uniref:Uncharacterized protein n=1 Tax=Lithospermum erythrorhizon TaxID=34254 RepID=A0AAV3PG07_LITER